MKRRLLHRLVPAGRRPDRRGLMPRGFRRREPHRREPHHREPHRRGAHRRRTRLLVGLVGLLLLAGLAGYAVFASGLFAVRTVSVVGTSRLSTAAVQATAQVPVSVPMARLDTAVIARRVSALPAVADVKISRRWPHTVRIAVTERVPLLAVARPDGYALVDGSGVTLGTVPAAPPRLPQAALPALSPSDPATVAALGVLRALSPQLRASMRSLEATSDSGVTLVLRDGRRVVWGANDRSAVKAEVLAALLKRKGRVYDVSATDIVTVAR